ncbi:MAG: N-acetylneuraminate synthase family protein [Rhodospirillales bacterium]|nr:N-acetylneuraminate synthase family protein [Rhodospirillales bacterium]
MNDTFNFRDLFVLDLANNHQGSVEHGLNIIRSMGDAIQKHKARAAIKFQFRQMNTFIHPDHHKGSDNKHIPRFMSTWLQVDDYKTLIKEVRNQGMLAICTPFDEESVDVIEEFGFDVIKIASCSARDWPLLERVAKTNLPVIFSTGGLTISQIDDLVSFFDHRACSYAIMHCVSIYPTPDELCNLANITTLRNRYPDRVIGWSTHEDPNDTAPVMVAVGQGAAMFERHVGLETDTIKLNAYSSTAGQINAWIGACLKAKTLMGQAERPAPADVEVESIESLKRGVFTKTTIKKGSELTRDMVFFAMPYTPGQLSSGDWKNGIVATADIKTNAQVTNTNVKVPEPQDVQALKSAVHEVKALLNVARIPLNSEFEVEYSHHYGFKKFPETGVVIINCINREYCKKILVQLAGQAHPMHFHKRKEETFQVLWGELHTELDGRKKTLYPGDTQLVMPGVWHRFWSDTGCVFEEVSTTHFNNDSVYRDPAIENLERHERKTIVDHWGRFQVDDHRA